MNKKKEFVDGLFVNRRDNAPDFVIANLGFNVDRFCAYLQDKRNEKGYVNIDILKGETLYSKLNTYKPKAQKEENDVSVEDLPF